MTRVPTYTRPDRQGLRAVMENLGTTDAFTDAWLLVERYGLSLGFADATRTWTCVDPLAQYTAGADTPVSAVVMWDWQRRRAEGDEDAEG